MKGSHRSQLNFPNRFFFSPYFSKLRSSINKNIKFNTDLVSFKENLSAFYKPLKKRHFKYGSKIGNRYITHLRVNRFFLNTHNFVTGPSNTDICLNCNENKRETIYHYVLFCPSYSLPRATMIRNITNLIPNFSFLSNKDKLFILLNGINTVNNIAHSAPCRAVQGLSV